MAASASLERGALMRSICAVAAFKSRRRPKSKACAGLTNDIVTSSPSNRLGGVDGASFCKRLTSQTEDVSGRVHVTVMNRSATATDPFSYSKVFQTWRQTNFLSV